VNGWRGDVVLGAAILLASSAFAFAAVEVTAGLTLLV
jgi:hypothetical protein